MKPRHARRSVSVQLSSRSSRGCRTQRGLPRRLRLEVLENRQLLSAGLDAVLLAAEDPHGLPADESSASAEVTPSEDLIEPGVDPGIDGDGVADIVIDLTSGNMAIDREGVAINGYVITSQTGIFTGAVAYNLGQFRIDNDGEISGTFIYPPWEGREHDLGDVIAPGEFAGVVLFDDLAFVYAIDDVEGTFYGGLRFAPQVVGRHVFYNNSKWDGETVGPSAQDDGAIAPDKEALRPGETATFANYTSYSRGINGIMIDVADLADAGELGADDFQFAAGNDDDPSGWTAVAAESSITVRPGEGVDGSDRVTIIWADNAIEKQWLEVTVLATDDTGLAENDVFYFGNAIAETGNSAGEAMVTSVDEIGARNNPQVFDPAGIDNAYDFNRDKMVTSIDQILARSNVTVFDALKLISVPAAAEPAATLESEGLETSLASLDWIVESQQIGVDSRAAQTAAIDQAVEELRATYGG